MTPYQIRAHRRTLGLSSQQMAEMLGYSGRNAGRHMRHIESGKRSLPPAHCRLLLAYISGYRPTDWPFEG